MEHLSTAAIDDGLAHVRAAPADGGAVEMIVSRPQPGERAVLDTAVLDIAVGLVGDCWLERGSSSGPGGAAHPDRQVTVMNARFVALIAGTRERWPLAGDQLYVDFDLGEANLPAGSRLAVGDAVVQVTAEPHPGCAKFLERFGRDAARFVNSGLGLELRLRGVNVRVVEGGSISTGAPVRKVADD